MLFTKTSPIQIVCPSCLGRLKPKNDVLSCSECQTCYKTMGNVPIMLVEKFINSQNEKTSNDFQLTDKTFMQELYNTISIQLNSSVVAPIAQFINYGYVANDSTQYSQPFFNNQVFNKKSIKLLGEAIGAIDLNGKRIIDVGCGRGGALNTIHKYYKPQISVGLDISYENVKYCGRTHKDRLFFLVGDAENLPFLDNSFDVIINMESSLNYPDLEKFYTEAYRILNTGGLFIYTDSVPTSEIMYRESFLKNLGFRIMRNTDATSNILLSLEESSNRSFLADKLRNNSEQRLYLNEDFLALPGGEKYRLLKEGVLLYKIYHLRK
ncbi:MAG: class I SAM-dependent methyltransferase [Firmicutes bacterium]|nr:class I SAM-dependent methyltransferase [Bacillota bacterium]